MQKLPSLKLNLRLDFATQFSQIVILRSTTSYADLRDSYTSDND